MVQVQKLQWSVSTFRLIDGDTPAEQKGIFLFKSQTMKFNKVHNK